MRATSSATNGVPLAEAQDHLGRALTAAGRNAEAVRTLERSLQIKQSLLAASDVGIARTLEALGLAHQRRGDYSQAGVVVRRAARIQEEANPFHPAYGETLILLGLQWWFEGNLPEARDVAAQSVAVAERTLRPEHPTVARALRYLAGATLDLGDLVEARRLLERALAIAEVSLGPSHSEMWKYPNDLAGPNRLLGAYPTARRLLEQALAIAEGKFGPWHDSVATSVHNLALVDASLGDYAKARREQVRAAAIWERVLGRNHPFVAIALMELATVYREQGSPAEALPLLERALSIRQSRLGPNHPDVARTLADLSATLVQLGATERAQAFATRAVRIAEGLDTPNAPDLAVVFALYADLQASRGNAGVARDYYQRALRILENAFGRQHPAFAEAEIGLAGALIDLNERQTALQTANDAEATAREHLRLMLRSLPERQALTYAMTRPQGLDLILSLVDATPDAAALAVDGVIKGRALVLDEMAYRRPSALTVTPATSPLRAAIDAIQQQLANLIIRGPGPLSTEQYVAALATLRLERERAELRLAESNASFRTERSRANVGLDEVMAALPPDSALVSLFRYKHQRQNNLANAAARRRQTSRTRTSYIAFVLRAGQPVVAISLGSATEIDRLVSKWRDDVVREAQPARRHPNRSGPRHGFLATRSARECGIRSRVFWPARTGFFWFRTALLLSSPSSRCQLDAQTTCSKRRPPSTICLLSAISSASRATAPRRPTDCWPSVGQRSTPARSPIVPRRWWVHIRTQPRSHAISHLHQVRRASFAAMTFGPLAGTLQEVRGVADSWNSQQSMTNGTASVVVGSRSDGTCLSSSGVRLQCSAPGDPRLFLENYLASSAPGTHARLAAS